MAILIILVCLIEEWALPGWGMVFVIMPLQYLFGYFTIKLKNSNKMNTQERNSFFQELLPAMKLVKYYGWEQFFEEAISDVSVCSLQASTSMYLATSQLPSYWPATYGNLFTLQAVIRIVYMPIYPPR